MKPYLCAMQTEGVVHLKFGKERSLQRFHPWVFSGAIHRIEGDPADGSRVRVLDGKGQMLGWGHYQHGSITIRMLGFGQHLPEGRFWNHAMERCFEHRRRVGLPNKNTRIFRLVHGEGDQLPGLVVDVYGEVAVVQCHSLGMLAEREAIAQGIVEASNGIISVVYDKSAEAIGKREGNGLLYGNMPEETVYSEHGHLFNVDFVAGQKTGFFIDQRENRQLLQQYAQGKTVLNTFCYTGGFSVFALAGGAQFVDSVDSSKKAIELTRQNVELNGFDDSRHAALVADVPEWLKTHQESYDIIILDPPAFAKHLDARHKAVQAYKRLNLLALEQIRPGGLLFTFSCSQVVDRELFRHTITAAAIESGRKASILHQLTQPADHPVSIYHPEGEYLKGLVLQVD